MITEPENIAAPPRKFRHFDRLEGNIKGTFSHELQPCVAFVGANRRGKTARLDAFRLALLGQHPVGPHGTNLMSLVPQDGLGLSVRVAGGAPGTPEWLQSTFAVRTENGHPKKPDKPQREGRLAELETQSDFDTVLASMLPATSMRDLVRLGSTLSREALFTRFGAVAEFPRPLGLDAEQLDMWTRGVADVRAAHAKADTAELLAALTAYFRQKKLALGRDARALQTVVENRTREAAPEAAGAEGLPALQAMLARARTWEAQASQRAAADAQRTQLEAADLQVIALKQKVAEAQSTYDSNTRTFKDKLASCKQTVEAVEAEQKALEAEQQAELEAQLEMLDFGQGLLRALDRMAPKADAQGHAPCVLCSAQTHVRSLHDAVAGRVEARHQSINEVKARYAVREAELAKRLKTAAESLKSAVDDLAGLEFRLKAALNTATHELQKVTLQRDWLATNVRVETEKTTRPDTAAYEGPSAAELETKIKTIEQAQMALSNLERDHAALRRMTAQQTTAKLLEQEATQLVSTLLTKTAGTAMAAVNRYMPEGFKAQLDLEKAQWTVVGRDGRAHDKKAMAGSEMGALTVALALAWTEGAPGRYLLLDDEDLAYFDAENLPAFLTVLKQAVERDDLTQVLIAWSRPHEIPSDWQTIHVDGTSPRVAPSPAKLATLPDSLFTSFEMVVPTAPPVPAAPPAPAVLSALDLLL